MRFYASRTMQLPLRAVGCNVLDAENNVVATTTQSFIALAMAYLANAGTAPVRAEEEALDEKERDTMVRMIKSRRKETN